MSVLESSFSKCSRQNDSSKISVLFVLGQGVRPSEKTDSFLASLLPGEELGTGMMKLFQYKALCAASL